MPLGEARLRELAQQLAERMGPSTDAVDIVDEIDACCDKATGIVMLLMHQGDAAVSNAAWAIEGLIAEAKAAAHRLARVRHVAANESAHG